MELGIKETRAHKEVQLYWMVGSTNPADLFTKEDDGVKHFKTLRDQMVISWEASAALLPSINTLKSNVQTIDSNPDILWGVLERGLADKNLEELTPLIKSKSMTRHKKSNKSSKYKDPNLSRSNGHESRHLEVACE